MSVEISEARKKLDMLERLPDCPELVFTDLYQQDAHCWAFLHEITMDNADMRTYLAGIIQKIDAFRDVRIRVEGSNVLVFIPSLKCGKFQQLQPDDQIAQINLRNHTYCLYDSCVNSYKEVLNETPELVKFELDKFWKQFENLTFSKRIRNAFHSLTEKGKGKLRTRLINFVYSLVVSKSKVENALERERKRVEYLNQNRQECYERAVERKAFYEKYAPEHIEIIKTKQREIAGYLEGLGYQEVEET